MGAAGAQRAPQPDLAAALKDGDDHYVGDADAADDQGDGAEGEEEALERGGCVGPGDQRVGRIGDLDILGRGGVGGRGEHGSDSAGALRVGADEQFGRQHRLAAFRMTLGARVAITFALLYLAAGAVLLTVNYVLFAHGVLGWAGAPVPAYTASYAARHDRALISNPQTPALIVAAARGQLAFLLAHPTEQFSDTGLLPSAQGFQPIQHGYNPALSQLLRQAMLILVPFALLTVALGWLSARRMLRPVRQLTATARRMSAANLSQRLHLAGPDDELKELGDTFDQMLARLDAAFESQRRFVANASHELVRLRRYSSRSGGCTPTGWARLAAAARPVHRPRGRPGSRRRGHGHAGSRRRPMGHCHPPHCAARPADRPPLTRTGTEPRSALRGVRAHARRD